MKRRNKSTRISQGKKKKEFQPRKGMQFSTITRVKQLQPEPTHRTAV